MKLEHAQIAYQVAVAQKNWVTAKYWKKKIDRVTKRRKKNP